MIDKTNFDKTNAWPFVEAKKLLRERKSNIEKKNKIVLQTGYGPSGLPHIGTFGEVARTTMIVNALDHLTDIPKEIITFSDDMDGLRKVPENVPNQEKLKNNLHKPLTDVPDPFEKFSSFGEHNNNMLKQFLDNFKFKYSFKSSTELYKSGYFNDTLKLVLENYEKIMEIILPTLGKERQKTYSPFLPICPETGKVLEIPVLEIDSKSSKIIFDNNGSKLESDPELSGLSELWGWWNGIAAGDIDSDGDIDYAVSNFGMNTKYHPKEKKPIRLFYGDFDGTGESTIVEAKYENDVLLPVRGRSCSSHAMPFLLDKFKTFDSFARASLQEIYTPNKLDNSKIYKATELHTGILINNGKGNFKFTTGEMTAVILRAKIFSSKKPCGSI